MEPPATNETAFTDADWERIEGFVGFGRRDAPVVFIGMEEGLRSADELIDDLAARRQYESVMDLKEAWKGYAGADRQFDPERTPRQPSWNVMAHLALRLHGNRNPSPSDRKRYRALKLGRADGDTLLMELLPYPHPRAQDWLYARFGRFETRAQYETQVLPNRIRLIRDILSEHNREVVICYGKASRREFERIFEGAQWRDSGKDRVTDFDGARIVLTDHFSSRRFSLKGMQELAEAALSPMSVEVRRPTELSKVDKSAVFELVKGGGEVAEHGLAERLDACQKIAVSRASDGTITSTCSLKKLRPGYNKDRSDQSTHTLAETACELGYVVTDPRFTSRGHAARVCAELLHDITIDVFATVREDNVAMQKILKANHFRRVGKCWPSVEHEGSDIGLWVMER